MLNYLVAQNIPVSTDSIAPAINCIHQCRHLLGFAQKNLCQRKRLPCSPSQGGLTTRSDQTSPEAWKPPNRLRLDNSLVASLRVVRLPKSFDAQELGDGDGKGHRAGEEDADPERKRARSFQRMFLSKKGAKNKRDVFQSNDQVDGHVWLPFAQHRS